MRFANPYLLFLLAPVAAAAAYAWVFGEKRRPALTYPMAELAFAPAGRGRELLVRGLPYALKSLALVLAILALARPQKVLSQAAGLTEGVDILLVMDTSISMRAIDFDPLDRMGAAKKAAADFIRRRVADRIGILVFAGDPVLSCPSTLDYEALLGFLDAVHPGMTKSDGTAIGDGLAAGVNHLKDSQAKSKVIVLLTDGSNNTGLVDPVTAAKTAKAYGIKVYTIGAAKRGEAMIPVDDPNFGRQLARIPDELDEDTLLKIAAEADGRYFRAENVKELASIYAEIDRLEKTEVKLPELSSYRDLYAWLLIPAALLLASELVLTRTLLLRIP